MELTILGCHSATPRDNARPTSQVLEIKNHLFLIDCGEGTQMAMCKNKVKFARIEHIFISHLHGDHVYGLIGLVSTFCLLGRNQPLTIYGPQGVKKLIELQLELAGSHVPFELRFRESVNNTPTVIFEDEKVQVSTIPLDHRVFTHGFLFTEKPGDRKLDVVACKEHQVDKSYYRSITKGKDYTAVDGSIIANDRLTSPGRKPRSYAFCSDTTYQESIIPIIKNVDMLYHESTFLKSHEHLCEKTKHSTAQQAASIAAKAGVGLLILGHFSSRYKNYELFKEEALPVFKNTQLAQDDKVFRL
ncbi:MAG: ribonuclease Z [Nonlabens sp.]